MVMNLIYLVSFVVQTLELLFWIVLKSFPARPTAPYLSIDGVWSFEVDYNIFYFLLFSFTNNWKYLLKIRRALLQITFRHS